MSSVSGLNARHRADARLRAKHAAVLALRHRDEVHYTQGFARWQGIKNDLHSARGQFPAFADCSSFVTWCLWNGLKVPHGTRDTVNDQRWQAGFTGTMLQNGKVVKHLKNVKTGDCVIYGVPGTTGKHTAIVVGRQDGIPMVISHGSEGGPFFLPYNYRNDIMCIRRYI